MFNLPDIWRVHDSLKIDNDPYESAKSELMAELEFEKSKSKLLDSDLTQSIDKLEEKTPDAFIQKTIN